MTLVENIYLSLRERKAFSNSALCIYHFAPFFLSFPRRSTIIIVRQLESRYKL